MPENGPVERYHDAVTRFKREYLSGVLKAHGGNRTRTARVLGLQRTYLVRLIREFELGVGVDGKLQAVPHVRVKRL